MSSRRVGGIRALARGGFFAALIAPLAMVLSGNAALAATVIGSPVGSGVTCGAGFDTVQVSWTSGTYSVPPGGGVITSWSTQAGPVPGSVGLQVWRTTATPMDYQLVGASPLVTPVASTLNSFTLATPIAVQAGDLLGLRIEGRAYCTQSTSSVADVYGGRLGANPSVGAVGTFIPNRWSQLDVAATVEAAAITPPPPPPPPPPPAPPPPVISECGPTDTSGGGSTDPSNGSSSDKPTAGSTGASDGGSSDKPSAGSTGASDGGSTDKPVAGSTATSDGGPTHKPAGHPIDRSTGRSNDRSTRDDLIVQLAVVVGCD
jgi:hypothetical protein